MRRRLGAAARSRVLRVFFLGHISASAVQSNEPPNFALELARGPFVGAESQLHGGTPAALRSLRDFVSRGSQRAAVRPALWARAQLSDGR